MPVSIISSKLHGILDYAGAAVLIALPIIAGRDSSQDSFWIAPTVAIFMLVYSFLTRYEAGFVGLLSLPSHLFLDIMAGLMLVTVPWLTDMTYYDSVDIFLPGIAIWLMVLLSKSTTNKTQNPVITADTPFASTERILKGS